MPYKDDVFALLLAAELITTAAAAPFGTMRGDQYWIVTCPASGTHPAWVTTPPRSTALKALERFHGTDLALLAATMWGHTARRADRTSFDEGFRPAPSLHCPHQAVA